MFEEHFTSSNNSVASVTNFSSSNDDYCKTYVAGLLSSKLRDKDKMKVCHVAIICSLTALLTILDLPLGSCDDVIIQKRVSTDGGKETLIRPVPTTEILVAIKPLEEYLKEYFIHIRRVRKSMTVLWFRLLVTVLPPGQGSFPDQNTYNLWLKLVIHGQWPAAFFSYT
jgi:hypothetical protein